MKVGVLALQGAFGLHRRALERLDVSACEVRTPAELHEVDALVIGGGESTVMSKLLEANELTQPLADRLAAGMPTLGTCAGLILLSREVTDEGSDQHCFAAVDISVRRNGYGRQVESFESPLTVQGLPGAFDGVFIRAPLITRTGDDVEVLASLDGDPVMCRQGPVTVCSFHPELTGDDRIHQQFLGQH